MAWCLMHHQIKCIFLFLFHPFNISCVYYFHLTWCVYVSFVFLNYNSYYFCFSLMIVKLLLYLFFWVGFGLFHFPLSLIHPSLHKDTSQHLNMMWSITIDPWIRLTSLACCHAANQLIFWANLFFFLFTFLTVRCHFV